LLGESRHDRLVTTGKHWPTKQWLPPPPNIIGRAEARALGLKRFFTGKPCKHGHVTERGVSNPECMECSRGRRREWRAANLEKARERARESARKYRAANLEKAREKEREYGRKRRATNPGRVREVRRAWRAANLEKARERARESARKYRAADPERVRENWRRWRAANLELAREGERERSLRYNKRQAAQRKAERTGSKLNGAGLTGL
jgi:hypothetical protein